MVNGAKIAIAKCSTVTSTMLTSASYATNGWKRNVTTRNANSVQQDQKNLAKYYKNI